MIEAAFTVLYGYFLLGNQICCIRITNVISDLQKLCAFSEVEIIFFKEMASSLAPVHLRNILGFILMAA